MGINKSPAFQFYPNEWLSSTYISIMTPAQEGAYIRLLCYAWNDSDCALPDDDNILSTLSRLGKDWKSNSAIIKKCFQPHPTIPKKLTNLRLQKEREKQKLWREKSRKGGEKSAKLRKSQGKTGLKGGSRVVEECLPPFGNSSSSSSSLSLKDLKDLKPPPHPILTTEGENENTQPTFENLNPEDDDVPF